LTPDECDRLLEELKKHSVTTYQMALISLDAGARFSEIAGLQWQNVDCVRETLALMDTKNGKNRTVYMTERIKDLFSGMPKTGPDALIFPDRNGNQIKHISKTFDDVVNTLGLNTGINDNRLKCVFHSLRHTHASRLLESGADIYRVKELLGHSSVTTTERYSHITADRLRSAIKDMEKMNLSNVILIRKIG
jgi:integrase